MDFADEQAAVCEWVSNNLGRLPLASVSDSPYDVARVLGEIHRRLVDHDLTVSGLLEMCEISSSGFYSQFKHHCSLPPGEYIEFLRMEAAKLIIVEHHEFHLDAVAYGLGYSDYRTFARAFKRRHGVAPSFYRD